MRKAGNFLLKRINGGCIIILYETKGRQYERIRVCADLLQQFPVKNMQTCMFTGLLRPFLGLFLIVCCSDSVEGEP